MTNLTDCDIVINEFELQSRYYAHFWTDTFETGINPFPPAVG